MTRPRRFPQLKRLRGPAVLLGIVLLANFNVVFQGQSLVATANYDPVSDDVPPLRPGGFDGVLPTLNWFDLGGVYWQWEPAGKMMSRAFRAGHIPLWDPEVGGGVDAHVNMLQTQYYPPYALLLLLGDTPLLRDLYYLAEMYVAGLFCFLLARRHGCGETSAVAMGVVYMLGGALTQTLNSSIGQSVAILPMMVWAVDRVLARNTWRAMSVGAGVLALGALSSFLPVVISGSVLVGCLIFADACWRFREQGRTEWARTGRALGAVLWSLVLIAFLLVPVTMASHADVQFQGWYQDLGSQHYSLDQLPALLSPSIAFDMGQLADANAQLFAPPDRPSPFYVGLLPLLFAAVAFAPLRRELRALRWFFALAFSFVLLKLLGALPVQWIALLPVFRQIHFIPYFGGALNFGVAGLAALGIENLVERRDRRTAVIASLTFLAIAIACIRFGQTARLNPVLSGVPLWSALSHYGMEVARLVLLSAACLAVLWSPIGVGRSRAAGWAAVFLLCLELGSLDLRARYLRSDLWGSPPPWTQFLMADASKFRASSKEDLALPANVAQGLGIDEASSRMAFNSPRYADVMRRYFGNHERRFPLAWSALPTQRAVLDVLNVKYVALFQPSDKDVGAVLGSGLVPVFRDGHYQVFRNPQVWGRAYLASSAIRAASSNAALDTLGKLEPGATVLDSLPSSAMGGSLATGVVDALQYEFDRIRILTHESGRGLLVLGENYAPGWSATVNGRPAPILHANYAFQAVEVPPGRSEVRFRYWTPGLTLGLWISGFGVALLLAFAIRWPRFHAHTHLAGDPGRALE